MAPEQRQVLCDSDIEFEDITTLSNSFSVRRPRPYRYAARHFRQPGIGGRYVMVGQDVHDVGVALYQWLAERWLAEAPELP